MTSVIEFYPADVSPETGPFLPPSGLQVGQEYRMLLTNSRGLYRYELEDVVVVESKEGNAPVIAFSHRLGNTSSLTGEKLTEVQVNLSMDSALAGASSRPRDFQLAPMWGEPPRYLLVAEYEGGSPPSEALHQLLAAFEEGLQRMNVEYASKRKSGRLRSPQFATLRVGEFERLRKERTEDRGRSDAQVKIPRLIRSLRTLDDYRTESVYELESE